MSAPLIPFILVGDLPGQPTGLSRIATDVGARLWAARAQLGIDLVQVAASAEGPLPLHGVDVAGAPWPVRAFAQGGNWGAQALSAVRARFPDDQPLVVLSCGWPLDRVFDVAQTIARWADTGGTENEHLWTYTTLDGANRHGKVAGPMREALAASARVAVAGLYAKGVVKATGVMPPAWADNIAVLPHGLNLDVWRPWKTNSDQYRAAQILYGDLRVTQACRPVLGCVATNYARKDLPLFFSVLRGLLDAGESIRGWLHVDTEVRDWSVPQLAEDFGVDARHLTVTTALSESDLATCYAGCAVTLAVGRGEGFGYPIVESLACGTPCVAINAAEGGAHVGGSYRIPVGREEIVGPYGIVRPMVNPASALPIVVEALERRRVAPLDEAARCVDDVQYLDWRVQWPHWERWIAQGLEALR